MVRPGRRRGGHPWTGSAVSEMAWPGTKQYIESEVAVRPGRHRGGHHPADHPSTAPRPAVFTPLAGDGSDQHRYSSTSDSLKHAPEQSVSRPLSYTSCKILIRHNRGPRTERARHRPLFAITRASSACMLLSTALSKRPAAALCFLFYKAKQMTAPTWRHHERQSGDVSRKMMV